MIVIDRFELEDFQRAAVYAGLGAIGRGSNELIVMPTGSGKSVAIAGLVDALPESRILILSHTKEIIAQDHAALLRHIPDLDVGIVCAGLKQHERGHRIILGTIHSMYRAYPGRGYNAVLVDEAHMVQRKETSMYRRLFAALRRVNRTTARMPVIGFSATPYRLDSGYLHTGPDALFNKIAYDVPFSMLLERGILAPLVPRPVDEIDFNVPTKAGEFDVEAYTETSDERWKGDTETALAQVVEHARERQKWVIFACTIRHAEAIADMLSTRGIRATSVHSKLKAGERDARVAGFRSGGFQAIANVGILTTGFDVPDLDCIILLRPTLSTGLYIQMIGRGMRRFPGKADCLLLDFGGNIERHGPMTDVIPGIADPVVAKRQRPQHKLCTGCRIELPTMARQCWSCGHLFSRISPVASIQDPMLPQLLENPEAVSQALMPSGSPYLSTEEVAAIIGTTPLYVKQMRHYGTGPAFSSGGAQTAMGYKQVIYRIEDVERWQSSIQTKVAESGYVYRLRTAGMGSYAKSKEQEP